MLARNSDHISQNNKNATSWLLNVFNDGSIENEDPENEDLRLKDRGPLRKRRPKTERPWPPTKTKNYYENKFKLPYGILEFLFTKYFNNRAPSCISKLKQELNIEETFQT